MLETMRLLYDLFTRREKQRLSLVFIAVLGTAIVEVAGIASIMPFLSVVSNPETIQQNEILSWVYNTLGFQSSNRFLFWMGVTVLGIITLSNTFAAIAMWGLYRFTWMRNHSLSRRLLSKYLHNPYEYFLNKNTSDLGKNTLDEVRQVVQGVLIPGLNMLARGIVALAIFGLLLFINPWLALMVTAILGGTYGLIYGLVRKTLKALGEKRYRANEERYKSVNEAFGGIKYLKLLGLEDNFLSRYTDSSYQYSSHQANSQIINKIPRYAIEIVAFGGLMVIILYLLLADRGLQQVLPLTGLYAFAGYRLKPQIHKVFNGFTSLRYNAPALKSLYKDVKSARSNPRQKRSESDSSGISFDERIRFDSVSYSYPDTSEPVIDDLNLTIKHGSTVAFAGETGAGKTTLADLVLGLLRPDSGKVLVDGIEITDKNVRDWQSNLGYIPQDIYLQDDTVASNIAFGVDSPEVDMEKVRRSSKMANIHGFIQEELPQGYQTVVGERGVRLSGGQKQRIGIARALYRDPEALVLDEATSDLDTVTERKVYEAIYKVAEVKTLIIIAHRLETIRDCDCIYFLEKGRIVSTGEYGELVKENEKFREMAGAGNQEV